MALPPRHYKRAKNDSEMHRKFLKGFECVLYGNPLSPCDIDHKVDLAHYRSAANSGTSMKPGPEWMMPLCRTHHREQHQIGQPAFERKYGIDMEVKAAEFAASSPDLKIKAAMGEYLSARKTTIEP